jgi:hypothetical protein
VEAGVIRVRDHRGRRVAVRNIRGGRVWAVLSHSAVIAAGAVVGLGAVVYVAWFAYRVGVTGGETGPGPLGLFEIDGAWAVALLVAAFGVWVPLLLGIMRSALRHELAAGRVRVGRCGACGYELAGVAAEGDGCRVCAECGAAWRVRA